MNGVPYKRTCSECGAPLNRPNQKTCSDKCRAARSRRLKRISRENGQQAELPAHQAAVAQAVRNEAPDVAHKLIQDELRPVVREAITEDVLQSLNAMVGLAPQAIQALANDLMSEDSKVRQKAYDLWLRYTIGHGAILRPDDGPDSKQLVVNFQLPRPEVTDSPGPVAQEDAPEDAEELRTCLMCAAEKPATEFVGDSDRCTECHEKLTARARELLGED